ncbi:MAG TPA: DUF4160 domain-containing protein [Phototrophicaceae bacterium]|nr:DUF4160 domain-containing protein [Phototrophicaceae bacterium]
MPKVHEEAGCKFFINTDDHFPPHVHVLVGGRIVVLELNPTASLMKETSASASDVKKAQRILLENRAKLRKAWKQLHAK